MLRRLATRVPYTLRLPHTRRNLHNAKYSPPVGRAESMSVLDTSQLQVTEQLRAERDRYRVSNLDTRIRLSHFLQAVFLGDYKSAIEDLHNFRSRCLRTTFLEKSVRIYTSCFVTLLTQLARRDRKRESMAEITALAAAVENLPKSVEVAAEGQQKKEIQCLIVLALLRELNLTAKDRTDSLMNLIAYMRDLLHHFSISGDDLRESVVAQYPDLIPQYNQVFQRHEARPNWEDEEYIRLKNALEGMKSDEHSLSFDSLCAYIENTSFDASAFSPQRAKYYEIFDGLPEDARSQFMDAYLKFNYKKQLLVEDASQNVYKSVSSVGKMLGFTSAHRKWIKEWLTAVSARLVDSLEGNELKKFAFVFDHLSPENVVSLCLTHVLSATVPSHHAKVYSLATRIGISLTKELGLRDRVLFSPKNVQLVFDRDHAVEFACTILKVLVETCQISGSMDIHTQHDDEWKGGVFQFCRVADENSTSKYSRYGAIKAHPVVAEHFRIYQELFQTGSYHLPMLYPPKKWTSPRDGGYLSIPLPLVKSSEPKTSDVYMEKAHQTGQLASVYSSVNALGECAWAINAFTLDTFNQLMESPNSPGLPSTLVPNLLENASKPAREEFSDDESYHSALYSWRRIEAENAKRTAAARSLRIYYGMVKRLANSFAKRGEVLYLPHNMDFRGRVYPVVSFLSHQSEDLVRSLLMFWEAKPLGPDGYDWLVYQLANLYSKSKMTMEQSKAFVESHRKSITLSATDPLAKNSWWLDAENPWQALALCKEMDQIWNYAGELSSYRSRIPVHQDGSCNGLQHYSALGADEDAAKAVNVLPHEAMQDVYMTVLGLVRTRIENDETCKNEETSRLARMGTPILSRKLIKQTVMTTVYGVTPFGATQQVKKRIDDLTSDNPNIIIAESDRLRLAALISHHVLASISDLFSGAKLIQNWLVENCTRCIQAYDLRDFPKDNKIDFFSGKHYRPMMWTSLSGFPVIQMYRKRVSRELVTPLQKLALNDDTRLAPIDENKSKNGIAPNFIHSIDAIHLLMTSSAAKSQGVTFAAVHDSFWTHSGEITALSQIIREEFARLHCSDIIENLRQDLAHVNRNSYQVVWATLSEANFIRELTKLRGSYAECGTLSGKKRLNACLQTELQDNSRVEALLQEFKPTLVWQSGSKSPVVYDDCTTPKSVTTKVSLKTHVPLLVPVKIVRAPAVGTLDIQAVLQSKYFFS